MANTLEEYSPEQVAEMATVYKELLENPRTREVTLRATKAVRPNAPIAELEIKDQVHTALKARDDKIETLENGIRERDARERVERERRALEGQGFTSDDVAEIEKIMVAEQIPNYGTAAKHYKMGRELATPTPATGAAASSTFDLPADALAAGKAGKQGLTKFSRSLADQAVADIQAGRIKLH